MNDKEIVVYSEYKAGNTVNQIKMALRAVFNLRSKPRVQYQIWKTGHMTLAST